MNLRGAMAIFTNELLRFFRTVFGSILSPVLTTSLYFIVFGSAIGSRIQQVDGVSYGAFIVPGLLMLTLLSESTSNASFGIYMPRFTGAVYELLSAPVGTAETLITPVGLTQTARPHTLPSTVPSTTMMPGTEMSPLTETPWPT